MDARLDVKRMLAACLLAGACAGAHNAMAQATGTETPQAAQSPQAGSSDATVSPAASAKQAREIASGDPVRWYQEDANGAQRMRTRQKEIGAALDEAKNACRQGPAAERPACLKAAQDTWQKEMNLLRAEAPARPGT
ncbi:hypothetical protein [Massilia sp. SYSU DXS3249]